MKINTIRISLVARPGKLTELTRHHLNTLDHACFPEDTLYPKEGCYWWLAMSHDGPVAFGGLKPLTGHNEGMAFLCRAGVLPIARGRGLQRRLIRIRLRMARKLKCFHAVITYVHHLNTPSARNLLTERGHLYTPLQDWGTPNALYFMWEITNADL